MSKITMEFTRLEATMLSVALGPKVQEAYDRMKAMLETPWDERDDKWEAWYTKERNEYKRWNALRNSVWEQDSAARKGKDINPYL